MNFWLYFKLSVTYKEQKKEAEKHVLQERSQLNRTSIIWRLEIQLCLLLWKVKKEFWNRQGKYLPPSVFSFFSFTLYSLLLSYFSELQREDGDDGEMLKMLRKVFGSFGLLIKRESVVSYTFEIITMQMVLETYCPRGL